MLVAGTGERLGALDVQLGSAGWRETDGGGKIARGIEGLLELHERARAGGEALNMVRVFAEKPVETNFRGVGPVGFEEHAAAREIDDGESGVERERVIVIGLGVVPFLVGAMQLAALEIE